MTDEEAVQQFLGDRPQSDQLREWRSTLEQRLRSLQRDRERALDGSGPALDTKITQLKKQIAALGQEEAITEFVEDSVRVTLHMGAAAEEVAADEWK